MGNTLTCKPKKDSIGDGLVSRSKRVSKSQRMSEEELLHRQALAMAIQQHQLSQRFEGSMSRRVGGSTSSRRHTTAISEPFSNGKQQVPLCLDNVETKKIVLVHGEGFGAWCWYKTISMLEEAGLHPIAVDLTASGIDNTNANTVTSLAEYAKPLTNYLADLQENEKVKFPLYISDAYPFFSEIVTGIVSQVILVGHSCGGASISYAIEHYPNKIAKAVFLTATMVLDGQTPFDIFAEELASAEAFMQESQFLLYGNGRDKPPTGLMFDKQQLKVIYFNQSPPKDIALATVSMRPMPLVPIMEKLHLTKENYGSVRKYFIQTLDDRMLSPDIQEKLVRENPPAGVYKIKGSDHCPFFSKPQSLNKILLEITQI